MPTYLPLSHMNVKIQQATSDDNEAIYSWFQAKVIHKKFQFFVSVVDFLPL